jgi:hypothetical protein
MTPTTTSDLRDGHEDAIAQHLGVLLGPHPDMRVRTRRGSMGFARTKLSCTRPWLGVRPSQSSVRRSGRWTWSPWRW